VASPATGTTRANEGAAAARLFARARRERVGGQIDQALGTYQRLQRGFPDSRECRLSYLVAGRLWLQRDRADLAATQFRLYLDTDPEGGASEEALLGHASALDRMGHFSEEAHDWRLLLAEHPGSIYARRARVRLDALETKQVRQSGSTPAEPRLSP
jgi:tetratricopeptide (TPR) repeat protein